MTITVGQAKHHASAIGGALGVVEHHAARVDDPQLTRALGVLHIYLGRAVVAAEAALGVSAGTVHPMGGSGKPPAV